MKAIVEVTGEFMLVDPNTGVEFTQDRPVVTEVTQWVNQWAGYGRLRIVENDLPDDASDAEFAEYHKQNKNSAVEAYMTSLAPKTVEPVKPKVEPKKGS